MVQNRDSPLLNLQPLRQRDLYPQGSMAHPEKRLRTRTQAVHTSHHKGTAGPIPPWVVPQEIGIGKSPQLLSTRSQVFPVGRRQCLAQAINDKDSSPFLSPIGSAKGRVPLVSPSSRPGPVEGKSRGYACGLAPYSGSNPSPFSPEIPGSQSTFTSEIPFSPR